MVGLGVGACTCHSRTWLCLVPSPVTHFAVGCWGDLCPQASGYDALPVTEMSLCVYGWL